MYAMYLRNVFFFKLLYSTATRTHSTRTLSMSHFSHMRAALPPTRAPRTHFSVALCGGHGGGDKRSKLNPGASEGESKFNSLPTAVFAELVQYKSIPERFQMAMILAGKGAIADGDPRGENVRILTRCPSAKDYTELQLNDRGRKAMWFHAMFGPGSSGYIRAFSREKFNTTTKAALPRDTDNDAVEYFVQMCPLLTHLNLSFCSHVTETGLDAVGKHCPRLTHINLHSCTSIADDAIQYMVEGCPRLTHLDLYNCYEISDAALQAVAEGCPRLTHLNLQFCTEVTDAGITCLSEQCSQLQDLNLRKCTGCTLRGLRAVADNCPQLISLNVADTLRALSVLWSGEDVYSVSFSPDGARIVSGSVDYCLRVWDAVSGQCVLGPLQAHTDSVRSVSFSPDGARIVSGSWDKTVRVWDAVSGQCVLGPLEGHTDWEGAVAV